MKITFTIISDQAFFESTENEPEFQCLSDPKKRITYWPQVK
jgi:hypothetical protein